MEILVILTFSQQLANYAYCIVSNALPKISIGKRMLEEYWKEKRKTKSCCTLLCISRFNCLFLISLLSMIHITLHTCQHFDELHLVHRVRYNQLGTICSLVVPPLQWRRFSRLSVIPNVNLHISKFLAAPLFPWESYRFSFLKNLFSFLVLKGFPADRLSRHPLPTRRSEIDSLSSQVSSSIYIFSNCTKLLTCVPKRRIWLWVQDHGRYISQFEICYLAIHYMTG